MVTMSMTDLRAALGQRVRCAAISRERTTITDHGQDAAVLISADELADIEDELALARLALAHAQGTSGDLVAHDEVKRRLGLAT